MHISLALGVYRKNVPVKNVHFQVIYLGRFADSSVWKDLKPEHHSAQSGVWISGGAAATRKSSFANFIEKQKVLKFKDIRHRN